MNLWVIYRDPADYPQFKYLMRRLIVTADGMKFDTRCSGAFDERGLEAVRSTLEGNGLCRVDRDPDDDPAILETWV